MLMALKDGAAKAVSIVEASSLLAASRVMMRRGLPMTLLTPCLAHSCIESIHPPRRGLLQMLSHALPPPAIHPRLRKAMVTKYHRDDGHIWLDCGVDHCNQCQLCSISQLTR